MAAIAPEVSAPFQDPQLLRAAALHERGDCGQAEAAYRDLLARDPGHIPALHLLGLLSTQTGRCEAGLALIDRALALAPDYLDALVSRAATLRAMQRPGEAVATCDRALALQPACFDAALHRGQAQMELGRFTEALHSFDRALAIQPARADALSRRGDALRALHRRQEALASYRLALTLAPARLEAWEACGAILEQLDRLDEALLCLDRALALAPAAARFNQRGNLLQALGRYEEALAAYERALEIEPLSVVALHNRGNALQRLRRLDAARAAYDRALAIAPEHPDTHAKRALLSLLRGDFEAGWADYEYRWGAADAPARVFDSAAPLWRGEDIAGRSIVIYDEQGLGDALMFSRYLTLLAERGAEVTFFVRASLAALMRMSFPGLRVTATAPEGEAFDFQCPLLSLPRAFQTRPATIPGATPYLVSDPVRVAAWRQKLGTQGFKIGVAWRGSERGRRFGRSFPLAGLAGLSGLADVRLVCLQKFDGLEQLAQLPPGMQVETLGADYEPGGDFFLDAGAVMQSLDLVVCPDTSLAHLAGALARPVWVPLPEPGDWKWRLDRADTPWYPTMQLFRQRARGEWGGAMEDMEAALRRKLGGDAA